jgi:hypothetical protein
LICNLAYRLSIDNVFYIEQDGQKYAYESTSVRVSGRKNSKTINTYLGKVDLETFKIIPERGMKNAPKE